LVALVKCNRLKLPTRVIVTHGSMVGNANSSSPPPIR
jgi:hypothetical protein